MLKTAIALGALVMAAGCSKAAPRPMTAAEKERAAVFKAACPKGWTQRAGKWVCHDPRVQEIYYVTGEQKDAKAVTRIKRGMCFIDAKGECKVAKPR